MKIAVATDSFKGSLSAEDACRIIADTIAEHLPKTRISLKPMADGGEGTAKGRTGFAIHGTNDPAEIGAAKSQGCVRMYNDDVVLIYNLLVSGRSLVEIVD